MNKTLQKVILIPDSFKGTLSSSEICAVLSQKIRAYFPVCWIEELPVADGGEGSVDCFLQAAGGEKITADVHGPYNEPMQAFYGLLDGGRTAVIEMAACAGLPLVEGRKNPLLTTTYGVGELMGHALKKGAKHLIVGLGGSATNDGGCGAAAALGACFYNEAGQQFLPTGGNLQHIARMDLSQLQALLQGITVTAMCDIDNPLCGEYGAAAIYAPQKGADPGQVELLDKGLQHLSNVIRQQEGMDIALLPGAGAAGGMGGGCAAFFHAALRSGIRTVLDTVDFAGKAVGADLIITGEGRLDSQSLRGKVVAGVAEAAPPHVPLIAVVGGAGEGAEAIYDKGVTAIFPINRLPEDFAVSRHKSRENLAFTADNLCRFIRALIG